MAKSVQVSRGAARIFRMLRDRPEPEYDAARVAREAETSNAGVQRALEELETAGIINIQEEE